MRGNASPDLAENYRLFPHNEIPRNHENAEFQAHISVAQRAKAHVNCINLRLICWEKRELGEKIIPPSPPFSL
jgi:hypothetical protein